MTCLRLKAAACLTLALLGGCATPATAPSVYIAPGRNKPPEVFAQDQAVCGNYANQVSAQVAQQVNNQQFGSAVVGTILGAGLGAAIGGGRGAAIGAASGATAGTLYGAQSSAYGQLSVQQQYDYAYSQCMYSRGNQIPGFTPNVYQLPPPPA
jgi:uncharacterized protein YcfJ